MTDDHSADEGTEEALEDLEAPAEQAGDVAGGICPHGTIACQLPTQGCGTPSCTGQTWCRPGTVQDCVPGTCKTSEVYIVT
jgi:hypothetical protein